MTVQDRLQALTDADHIGSEDLFSDEQRDLHRQYVRLAKSDIEGAGIGVFAVCDIPADTYIGAMQGRIVGTNGRHVMWHDTSQGYIFQEVHGPFRYANHSAEPNIELEDGTFMESWIHATRDIKAGEELLWDYGETAHADDEDAFETDLDDLHPTSIVAWLQERDLWDPVAAIAEYLDEQGRARHKPKEGLVSGDQGKRLKQMIQTMAFRESDTPFKLKSGKTSHIYFDLRMVLLNPEGLNLAAETLYDLAIDLLEEDPEVEFDAIAGVLDGGAPLATAVSLRAWDIDGERAPIILVRKEAKDHGVGGLLMGAEAVSKESNVLVVEDVITTGGSVLRAAVALREHGYKVTNCFAVLDREEGGREALAKEGIQLNALFTKRLFTDKE